MYKCNIFTFPSCSLMTSRLHSSESRKVTVLPINTQAHHNTILHNTPQANTPGRAMDIKVLIATTTMAAIVTANMVDIATANMVDIVMIMGRRRLVRTERGHMEVVTAMTQIMITSLLDLLSLMVSHLFPLC